MTYPAECTIAGRVMAVLLTKNSPVTFQWICRRLIKKPRHLSQAIDRLVRQEWVIETENGAKRYQASVKTLEHLAQVRPRWDDQEHQDWMRFYRARFVERIQQEVMGHGFRKQHR